jgi:hypothetical protein
MGPRIAAAPALHFIQGIPSFVRDQARPIAMPFFFFLLIAGGLCLGVGIAYIASPRFVEWTITKDRRGQQWARLLGRERATYAMRHYFSLILIVIGSVSLYFSYVYYGAD